MQLCLIFFCMCSVAMKIKTWDYDYASFQRKFRCCFWNAACVPKLVKLWRILLMYSRLLNCLVIELPLLLDKWNCGGSGRAEIHWVPCWCSWYLQQAKVLATTVSICWICGRWVNFVECNKNLTQVWLVDYASFLCDLSIWSKLWLNLL